MDQLPNTPASSAPSPQPGPRMPIPRVNPQAPAHQSYVDIYDQQLNQPQPASEVQSPQTNSTEAPPAIGTATPPEQQNMEQTPPQEVKKNETTASQTDPGQDVDQMYAQNQIFPDYLRPQQEYLLFEWEANSRPFKKHNRQYFTTVATIALLVCLILFFSGQFLPIAVVIAVAFVVYVMATIPPHKVNHQITTFGIRIENALYYWEEMGRFWFTKKFDDDLLHVEVARFPERLSLVLGGTDVALLREILSEVLLEEKPLPTYYERMAGWLQEKFPLDI